MESLRTYLNSLETEEQESFADRCGTSLGYLRKVLSTKERIRESLAISLEKESAGAVPIEETRPDVDWEYLRGGSSKDSSGLSISRKVG